MSQYYNPQRTRNIFTPSKADGFKLSRSKIDLFMECPRCFYIDRRLGTGRPPGYPFAINSAVDGLLKKEFDVHRAEGRQHPLQEQYGLDLLPAPHKDLDVWRENFKGLQYHDVASGFVVTGAIDDLWQNPSGEYIIVDYKATAKAEPVTALDKPWQDGYKRQMEVYQWLLRKMGERVSDTGYFVYCTGRADAAAFDAKVEFDVHLIPYNGSDAWVSDTLLAARACLDAETIPEPGTECDYCAYTQARAEHESLTTHKKEKQQGSLL